MEKITLQSLQGKIKKHVSKSASYQEYKIDFSNVFQLKDGSFLKIFDANIIQFMKNNSSYDIERKILEAKPVPNVPEILIPTKIVYDEKSHLFQGYILPAAKGITINQLDDRFSKKDRADLWQYANLYHLMEDFIKRAHTAGFVFPDFGSLDNLYIYDKNHHKQLSMIDYDGMQIGDNPSTSFSSILGNQGSYFIPKYWDETKDLFKPSLDIKSLIIEYFLLTFNVNLSSVGQFNPETGRYNTLDDVFEQIHLDDDEIKHKVWKLFQPNEENEYLGDSVYRLAETHHLLCEQIRLSELFNIAPQYDRILTFKQLVPNKNGHLDKVLKK